MNAFAIVAMLATNVWAASGYEVINQGDSVEVRPLPDLPEPEELNRTDDSFFKDAPPLVISPRWGVAKLAEAYITSVRGEDRVRVLNRLGEVRPRDSNDVRALMNLLSREDSTARAKVEASMALLSPADSALAPTFLALLEDEDTIAQTLGLVGSARLQVAQALAPIRKLAEREFPAPQPSLSMSPADANRWALQFGALKVLAEWEGEKARPLVLKVSKTVPAAGEVVATQFWEKAFDDMVDWSESRQAHDLARAAKAWGAPVPCERLTPTKARLWSLALDRRRKVETRHRAVLKLGPCADEADVDRFVAERANASGKDRALMDAGLFSSRHAKAVPALVEYAKTSSDPLARAGAMYQLRTMLPASDYRALLQWAAKNDPDPENRANAAAELR